MSSTAIPAGPRGLMLRGRVSAWHLSRSVVLVTALTALAAAIRFAGLAHQSYWYDEAHTVWLLHFPFGGMLARLQGSETSPPVYFALAWLWAHLFGYGEAGVRSLSALAGVITVPLAYAAGAKLFSRRVGLVVAALTACNPLLVWYSQEARSYALLVLLTSIGLLAFAHLRARPTRGWAITWAFAAALALGTHYYAALVVVPQAVWLFARHRRVRFVRIGIEAVVVWSSALAVLAWLQMQFLTDSGWIKKVPLVSRAADVPKTFAIGPAAPASGWLLLGCMLGVVAAVWLIARRADRPERQPLVFVSKLVAAGCALVVVLVMIGFDQLDYRNMLPLWLPVALLVASGLSVHRAGAVGAASAILLCGTGLAAVIGVTTDARLQRPAWHAVATAIGPRTDTAILMVNGCQLLPLSLYVPGLHFVPASGAPVREIDVVTAAGQGSWHDVLFSGWYVDCKPQRGPLDIPARLDGLRRSGPPVRINQFSIFKFRSPVPVHVTEGSVRTAGLQGALMIGRAGSTAPTAGYSGLPGA